MSTSPATLSNDLEAQRAYEEMMQEAQFDFGLSVAEAFVKGIRDIGYKSTATALDEHIDNAIQAGASKVHVIHGNGATENKPDSLAVLDDGHGMFPGMVRLSVIWGGTHRFNDRTGMGRYGYGLPSAAVSQGPAFSVLSRVEDGDFFAVRIDVDEISAGKYTVDGRIQVPEATPSELPAWVAEYARKHFGKDGRDLRTVIVIDRIDRTTWKTASAIDRNLLEHFGLVYRNYLRKTTICVQGKKVEPLDPLFLTEGARYYDLTSVRAEGLPPLTFEVKDRSDRSVLGRARVRFSYMPPTFQLADPAGQKRGWNKRMKVMREHNGIVVLRAGRQIDVVTRFPAEWSVGLNNYDRNWAVEIDFDPALDELFRITTSKQQIVLTERMWELLREHGVRNVIKDLRNRFREEKKVLDSRQPQEDEKRVSEQVMEEAEKFKTAKVPVTFERIKAAEEGLEEEVRRRSEASGVEEEKVRPTVEEEVIRRPFKVEEESMPEGPFYVMKQRGGQKVLILNTAHRFYQDLYAPQGAGSPRLKSAIEVLLFVLGDCELDATEDRSRFYRSERVEWSSRLETALELLDHSDLVDDAEDDEAAEDAPREAEDEVASDVTS